MSGAAWCGDDFRAILSISAALRKHRPDLVACHSRKASLLGRVAAWSTRTPAIFNSTWLWAFTDGAPPRQRMMYQVIEHRLSPLAAKLICVSEFDRQLVASAGIAEDRLVTIRNRLPNVDGVELVPASTAARCRVRHYDRPV